MSYTKTTWADETLSGAERFDIKENGGDAFKANMQIVLATGVTAAGTAVTAAHMNHIEEGIEDASMLSIVRQGGSATDWSVAGTTNYTPVAKTMQFGSALSSGNIPVQVTFPLPFADPPLVFVTCNNDATGAPCIIPILYYVTANGCELYAYEISTATYVSAFRIYWQAIGVLA